MKRTIRELERKLNDIVSKNQIIKNEVLSLKKEKQVTKEALRIAKSYYSSVWDININIQNSQEDNFTCIVNFEFAYGMYPIKFVINRNSQDVLDWDGSSLLTTEEENEMKERFHGVDNYFPQVLSELRLIALNKIKLS
ncbi:hypothetical protein HHI36_018663 [Cryptolaemus montrouzieri]|uniref:Uncharacterized protein n=1 Tax=Cryptolaemus montrouzieri TaxID=559131 RepID=A0ABD2P0T3_9CUCU